MRAAGPGGGQGGVPGGTGGPAEKEGLRRPRVRDPRTRGHHGGWCESEGSVAVGPWGPGTGVRGGRDVRPLRRHGTAWCMAVPTNC